MKNSITQEELKRLLRYDTETGEFTWLVNCRSRFGRLGSIAGSPDKNGHLLITVQQKRYSAHRLAWLYVYGKWPDLTIDHINSIPSDNRILNLRDVSHAVNMQNLKSSHKDSMYSGLLGVRRSDSTINPWAAVIQTNKKFKHIGVFKTPEEAHSAYLTVKRQLHEGNTL
jgi:hypothetical protein